MVMIQYHDFHTHTIPADDTVAAVDGRDTWGIHPWQADAEMAVPDRLDVLAIGECGLDALRGPSLQRQEEVFARQIALSEQLSLPLVIHCVKALDRLLALRRQSHARQPWLFHGFRGKPQQLRSLLDAGFFVSFGFLYNAESLRLCPSDRLCLETDTTPRPISELYGKVAAERGYTLEQLCTEMAANYRTFYQNVPNSAQNVHICP